MRRKERREVPDGIPEGGRRWEDDMVDPFALSWVRGTGFNLSHHYGSGEGVEGGRRRIARGRTETVGAKHKSLLAGSRLVDCGGQGVRRKPIKT
jgi:hypothetical protein